MPLAGIEIFSAPSRSPTLRRRVASWTAPLTSARARVRNRWRLPRLLPFGLRRRSTMFMAGLFGPFLAGLADPHVPLNESANLAFGITARDHALEELGVLALGFAVFLAAEADHRQELLDLREHPLLDHLTELFVRSPGRVAPGGVGPRPQGELDHLVAENLGISDARGLLDLRQLLVQELTVHQLARIGVLVVLVLDPRIGIGDVAVEQVLAVVRIGLQIRLLDLVADEIGVALGQLGLDEVQELGLGLLRE